MTGSILLNRVRRLLKDVQSDTEKGEFWSDSEIYLALNNAQLSYASYLIKAGQYHQVAGLLTNTPISAGGTLPADYFMYASAYVDNAGDIYPRKIAKIYIGGEAWSFRFVKDTSCWIIGDNYGFVDSANYDTAQGVLYYYSYPSTIIAGNFNDDFAVNQYTDVIVHIAAIYLSMKEPQTQRDFKRFMATIKDINTTFVFEDIVYYVVNYDVSQFYQRYISEVRRQASSK